MEDFIEEVIAIDSEDIPPSQLTWPGADANELEFMRKVYNANLTWSSARGAFLGDIPEGELETIEGKHKAKKDAAMACREMLAAARKAISAAGVNVKTGLTSAYRSATRQLQLWQSYFPNYYRDTMDHRATLAGGPLGDTAVADLASYIRPKVAIPGYSNHQNGIAVDLLNNEEGKDIRNKTRSPYPARWRESWLWSWLESNANSFGFFQNSNINEPWHWEYKRKSESSNETFFEEEDNDNAPVLLDRESSPLSETLYVKINLGLRKERVYKNTSPNNETATVQPMTGIFIPQNFVASPSIDILIYLHGHKSEQLGKDKSINDYWNAKRFPHFAFRELLNDSGSRMILVAPTLGPRSQAGTLTTNSGFTNFINQVIAAIVEYCHLYRKTETPSIRNIILSCHSGGGFPMYRITQLTDKNEYAAKIKECWGFDCTYGPDDDDALYTWASTGTTAFSRGVFIWYRKNSLTERLAKSLRDKSSGAKNIRVTEVPNSEDHNLIPLKYMRERLMSVSEVTEILSEEECNCGNTEYETYTGEDVVVFPSGEQLTITTGQEGEGEEYYDPNQSGNPLLDTSGANKDIKLSGNFSVGEFAQSGATKFDKARIDPDLVRCLQAIRDHVGKSVSVHSGYRSYAYNQKLSKRSKNVATRSQHMSGRAADIAIDGYTGYEIGKIALDVFRCNIGIGVAPGFAHIDVRSTFATWRYAGDPDEITPLVDKIKEYHAQCVKKSSAESRADSLEASTFMIRTSPVAAAVDLFKRGYINADTLTAIYNGERDVDVLTDMVFNYRHSQRAGLAALINITDDDRRRYRKEWQQIRTKIIEPLFNRAYSDERYGEISTGTANGNDPYGILRGNEEVVRKIDDPFGRIKWFTESRFGTKRSPSERQLVAFADAAKMVRQSKAEAMEQYDVENLFDAEGAPNAAFNNWVPIGPSVVKHGQASSNPEVSGRVTSIAVGPGGKRVYIGTANGGVWFSPDEGVNWEPLDQWSNTSLVAATPGVDADSLSIGAMAVAFNKDKRDKDLIYAGTGEPLAELIAGQPGRAISALYYFGVGIKVSRDGGKTWKLEASKELLGHAIYKIAIDPDNSSVAFAATSRGLYKRSVSGGIAAWKLIPAANYDDGNILFNTVVSDIVIAGSGATKKYYAAFWQSEIYQSTDGINWKHFPYITGTSTPVISSNVRKVMSASESKPETIYVLDGANNIFRLIGADFKQVNNGSIPNIFNGGQGNYSIALAVDPLDDDTIYIAGDWIYDGPSPANNAELYTLSLFKGKVNKATMNFQFNSANASNQRADATYVGSGIHADGHVIALALNASATSHDSGKVWIGCDGGVFYSDRGGTKGSFSPKNKGLAITQLTYFSQDPIIPSVMFSGSQDNGTLRYTGYDEWTRGGGYGDGGGVAIDPNNGANVMSQSYKHGYFKTTDRADTSWKPINQASVVLPISAAESRATRFYSPIESFYDSAANKTLFALGTTRLWFSNNGGSSWVSLPNNVNPYLTTPPAGPDYLSAPISSIKIVSAKRILATTETDVFQYDLVGASWTLTTIPRIGLTPGQYFITCIDSEPGNINNFYVSLGGPGSFNRCYYCYLDSHGSYKWVALGPSKLDIPCHVVLVDPSNPLEVYLGSDVGVWKRSKNPDNPKQLIWLPFSHGLPESPISDLKIQGATRTLHVATHGRGMYEIPLDFPGAKGSRKTKKIDLYLKGNKLDNRREDAKGVYPFSIVAPDPDNSWLPVFMDSPDIWVEDRRSFRFVIVNVHNRGFQLADLNDIWVTVIVADGAGSLPPLPADLLTQVQSKKPKVDWTKTQWKLFGQRNARANINSLVPQVAELGGDLSVWLPKSKEAWIVAIVTTLSNDDPFKATEQDVTKLILKNKQIACKKVKII